ncbi:MAG TPA: peptidoglycan-binding domain-containing protein [Candidatus Udaeobacter sp.]|jgi:hypothetical protein
MKTKGLLFITCLAAGALIASPAQSKPAKKSTGRSSQSHRMAARPTQITPHYRHNQSARSQVGSTRYYGGTRYSGTRSYAGPQSSGTRYYSGTARGSANTYYGGTGYYNRTPGYRANTYYRGTGYYYGGGSYPYYSYSGWPSSNWGYGTSWGSYPYSYYGGYPYSGYNNYYSYYTPTYGYDASMVASVQRRLGQLGYYDGAVDGIIGPQTRGAIAAFESRNGLVVDASITRPLLFRLGLA